MIEVSGLTRFGSITRPRFSFRVERRDHWVSGPQRGEQHHDAGLTDSRPLPAELQGRRLSYRGPPIEVKRRVGYMPENVPAQQMLVNAFLRYVAVIKPCRAATSEGVDRVWNAAVCKTWRVVRNLSKGYRQRLDWRRR